MGNNGNKQTTLHNGGFGLRILKVNAASPLGKMKLEPFLDFIVTITACATGESPTPLIPQTFFELLNRQEGNETELGIYNIRSCHLRFIKVVPNRNWEGADGLLGLMIRFEEFSKVHDNTFKVLKVMENSPAALAGLEAEEDFFLGFTHYNHKNFDDFINILRNLENSAVNTVELCVFNKVSNQVRFLYLSPDRNWGGEGTIGCEFGSGLLNQLPKITYDISQNEDLSLMSSTLNPINPPAQENPLEKMGGLTSMVGLQDLGTVMNPAKIDEKKPEKPGEENESDEEEIIIQKQEPPRQVLRSDFVMPKPLTEEEVLQQTGVYNMIMNKRQQLAKKGLSGASTAIVPPKNPFSVVKNKAEIKPTTTPIAATSVEKKTEKQGFEVDFVGKPRYDVQEIGETAEETTKHEEEVNPDVSDNNSFLNSLSNQFEEISISQSSHSQANVVQQVVQEPKALASQETALERDKQARKDSRPKMTMIYSFFSQKLNGEYIVNSEDLFQTDIGL